MSHGRSRVRNADEYGERAARAVFRIMRSRMPAEVFALQLARCIKRLRAQAAADEIIWIRFRINRYGMATIIHDVAAASFCLFIRGERKHNFPLTTIIFSLNLNGFLERSPPNV
jgi:hypothetical protein